MRWVIIIIAVTFVIGGLYVGAGVVTDTSEASPPVAEVNGQPISEAEFQHMYSNNLQLYSQFFGPIQGRMQEEVMYASLQDLIVDKLVRAAAAEAALPVDASEIDAELAELKDGFPDDATYRMALAQSGLTENQLRDLLRDELSVQKLQQSVRERAELSEEEIESLDESALEAAQQAAEEEQVQQWLEGLREEAVIAIRHPQMQAYDYVIQGRYEEALAEYEAAMVTDPFNPYLYVSQALVYEELDQPEAALEAYESAISMDEDDAMLYVHLGAAYRKAERDEEAAEQLRIAGELNPWDAQLQMTLMQMFTEMELEDDAAEAAARLDELQRLQGELDDEVDAPDVEFDILDETPEDAVESSDEGADASDEESAP